MKLVLLVVALSAVPLVRAPALADPPAVPVHVNGVLHGLPPGTTFAAARRQLRLAPHDGNLLAVDGRVLERGIAPGRLLLNGRPALETAQLRAGDRIAVVDGADAREPLSTATVFLETGRPAEPQSTLALTPGVELVTSGMLSHSRVSSQFVATGPPLVPDAVALTFDDGPSAATARVLDVLRRLHVPATFFVVGVHARERPDLVRAEIEAGMGVGDHSYGHPPGFGKLPPATIDEEMRRGKDALTEVGAHVVLFRPPGGSDSPTVLRTAGDLGLRVALWSVDPRDWQPGVKPKAIVRRVLGAVRPGSIVLLHDGGGERSATVAALPAIVKGIRARGLRLVRLGEAARPPRAIPWFICLRSSPGGLNCI